MSESQQTSSIRMAESEETETEGFLLALKLRMMRHLFDHALDQGAVDARSGMTFVRNALLKENLKSPIPEQFSPIIERSSHEKRLSESYGPFIVFHDSGSIGVAELKALILNPEVRIRRAALDELDRQIVFHNDQGQCFLSPQSRQRIDKLRNAVTFGNAQESVAASIEISDVFEEDYFYRLAGVRQAIDSRLGNILEEQIRQLLLPSERSIEFLEALPVWNPARQREALRELQEQLVDTCTSFSDALSEYFRLFGHLPLANEFSMSGTIALWRERHGSPPNVWDQVWKWAKENNTPLAVYHACQLLCRNPNWVPHQHNQALLEVVLGVVSGVENDRRWKLRCDLARHYCQHLELLDVGPDGDRISAFAWWMAEHSSCVIERVGKKAIEFCLQSFRVSAEVWTVARPAASLSVLRYGTLFLHSAWATGILCEFFDSELKARVDQESDAYKALERAACKLGHSPVVSGDPRFAFEKSAPQHTSVTVQGIPEASHQSLLVGARSKGGLEQLLVGLPEASSPTRRVVAHEMRLQSTCGTAPYQALFDSFSKPEWRNQVLVEGDEETIELICSAMIEISSHDQEREWAAYLPHFLAMACESATFVETKRLLFAATVVASLSANSVSAVERLLRGEKRRDYEEFVAKWRQRIENLTSNAPAWIAAKLRGIKCVLHI